MTMLEAVENAITFLESIGYTGGDIHDDLSLVASRLQGKYARVGQEEL